MPGLWTLGFLLLCGACVSVWVVLGLGFRLRHATPGWGDGVCVCLRARSACGPPVLAGVCGVGVCAWARASAAPRHSWLGCWVCVCLCAHSACTPPLLAGVCVVAVCAWAGVWAAPRHSCLGFWGVCVLVCALRFYHATPDWGVRCGRVCLGSGCGCAPPFLAGVLRCAFLCARSACTPPLLAGVCGVGVCAWCWVSAAPRNSWLGCWGVRVRALLVPRHSWLACAVWVCVLGLGFRLRPATPGWGVGVCVCLCARSACTPPLLAGVCGVGVCARARVSAAPRLSWLGCSGVCVFVCALRLYPAAPGWTVRHGCVRLGSGSSCAPPLQAGL